MSRTGQRTAQGRGARFQRPHRTTRSPRMDSRSASGVRWPLDEYCRERLAAAGAEPGGAGRRAGGRAEPRVPSPTPPAQGGRTGRPDVVPGERACPRRHLLSRRASDRTGTTPRNRSRPSRDGSAEAFAPTWAAAPRSGCRRGDGREGASARNRGPGVRRGRTGVGRLAMRDPGDVYGKRHLLARVPPGWSDGPRGNSESPTRCSPAGAIGCEGAPGTKQCPEIKPCVLLCVPGRSILP